MPKNALELELFGESPTPDKLTFDMRARHANENAPPAGGRPHRHDAQSQTSHRPAERPSTPKKSNQATLGLGSPFTSPARSTSHPYLRPAGSSANLAAPGPSTPPRSRDRDKTADCFIRRAHSTAQLPRGGVPATPPRTGAKQGPYGRLQPSPFSLDCKGQLRVLPLAERGAGRETLAPVVFVPNAGGNLVVLPPSVARLEGGVSECARFVGSEAVQLLPAPVPGWAISVQFYWPGYATESTYTITTANGRLGIDHLLREVAYAVSVFLHLASSTQPHDEQYKLYNTAQNAVRGKGSKGIKLADVVVTRLVHCGGSRWTPEFALLPSAQQRQHCWGY